MSNITDQVGETCKNGIIYFFRRLSCHWAADSSGALGALVILFNSH